MKPNQLNFKIFDTKGAPEGAIKAAKQGIACAACSVGTFYETGILGISRNKKKAFE